jgi:tetratricopeptide (TPR) repeat protein
MSDTTTETRSISHRIGAFLTRYRTVLLVVSIVIVGGIILAVGVYQLLERRAENAARSAELLEERWDEWRALPEEERAESPIVSDIRDTVAEIGAQYERSYGDLRARSILASLEWQLERYEEARSAYLSIADEFPRSHLAAISLAGAAAASENLGEIDRAREYLERIASGEGAPSSEMPRALFNLGRLAETDGDYDTALEYYNRLVDEYGGGSWTNLGRDRIIWLASQGLGTDD